MPQYNKIKLMESAQHKIKLLESAQRRTMKIVKGLYDSASRGY